MADSALQKAWDYPWAFDSSVRTQNVKPVPDEIQISWFDPGFAQIELRSVAANPGNSRRKKF